MATVVELYGDYWPKRHDEFAELMRESLSPRGPEMLFDLFAELDPQPGQLVLDIGGRDAKYSIELVERFDVRALMIDPIPAHLEKATDRIKSFDLAGRVITDLGEIERLPLGARSIDHIWCRDVLNHTDVSRGLAECARVLNRGGILVYQTFATPLLEPNEAGRLYRALAINPESMSIDHFEATANACGFEIVKKDHIDSEWRERWAESGESTLVDDLLAIARMRRTQDALIRHYGEAGYEAMLGGYLWGIYQMLGKLQPIAYLLRKQPI